MKTKVAFYVLKHGVIAGSPCISIKRLGRLSLDLLDNGVHTLVLDERLTLGPGEYLGILQERDEDER